MSDEMPEVEWSKQSKALSEAVTPELLEAMSPWFEMLEGWVSQAKRRGYTDEQARFAVLHGMGWRPKPLSDDGGGA